MKTLKNLFLSELADVYDAEQRSVKGLGKMARAATCEHLQKIILDHLEETKDQVEKLKEVFECFDEKVKGKKCRATMGLLEEAEHIADDFKGSPALNAGLIAAAQKLEHYEIATYGCLHEWAENLGNSEAAHLLDEILEEEKAANDSLNDLAHSRSNREAVGKTLGKSRHGLDGAKPSKAPKGLKAVLPKRGRDGVS